MLYHLYVGKYLRNGDIKGNSTPTMTEVLFRGMDNRYNEEELCRAKSLFKKLTGKHYFKKKEFESTKTLNREELENNEDELIRIMHYRFLRGYDKGLFNYEEVDHNEYVL